MTDQSEHDAVAALEMAESRHRSEVSALRLEIDSIKREHRVEVVELNYRLNDAHRSIAERDVIIRRLRTELEQSRLLLVKAKGGDRE